jgi:hypothetical protein
VYPGLSSHEARLRKLKAELAELGYESLPSLVDRLDAALQQQHELCSGMVKLIEEAVEGAAS